MGMYIGRFDHLAYLWLQGRTGLDHMDQELQRKFDPRIRIHFHTMARNPDLSIRPQRKYINAMYQRKITNPNDILLMINAISL